jgi:hypothetical protein
MRRSLALAPGCLLTWLLICLLTPSLPAVSRAQGKAAATEDFSAKPPTADEMAQMQKRWMETTVPGKPHHRFDYFIGSWDTTMQMWMGGPESTPMESKGSASFRWLVDGRWVMEELKGQMMGQPYEGYSIHGYDNFKKKYVGVALDNMGTAMLTMKGLLDQSGTTMIEYGEMDEPMTGEVGKHVKYVTRIVDESHFSFEIHDLDIGETNTKVIQIDYTRRKG